MKQVFFIAAIILAFIATFITIGSATATDSRGWRVNINFLAGAFLCWLLSQASFIS